MSHTRTTATLFGMIALLLVACSGPRKASERACNRAERHLAKAVWLCPEVLEADTTARTVTTVLPGDSATVALPLAHSLDVDSILAECDQLRAVIAAERDLYAASMLERKGAAASAVAQEPSAERRHAVQRLQAQVCLFEDLVYEHELFTLTVRPGQKQPLVEVRLKERTATAECPPCPPVVKLDRTVVNGVAPGWKTFGQWTLGVLSALLLGVLVIVYWVVRNHHAG